MFHLNTQTCISPDQPVEHVGSKSSHVIMPITRHGRQLFMEMATSSSGKSYWKFPEHSLGDIQATGAHGRKMTIADAIRTILHRKFQIHPDHVCKVVSLGECVKPNGMSHEQRHGLFLGVETCFGSTDVGGWAWANSIVQFQGFITPLRETHPYRYQAMCDAVMALQRSGLLAGDAWKMPVH